MYSPTGPGASGSHGRLSTDRLTSVCSSSTSTAGSSENTFSRRCGGAGALAGLGAFTAEAGLPLFAAPPLPARCRVAIRPRSLTHATGGIRESRWLRERRIDPFPHGGVADRVAPVDQPLLNDRLEPLQPRLLVGQHQRLLARTRKHVRGGEVRD